MKRLLFAVMAVLMVVAIAAPAPAAVEWKFGGQFRARYIFQDNVLDADDNFDDSNHLFDQRLRLYFTAQASENLKMVVRFEMGDTVWGQSNTTVWGGGGRMGADQTIVELKNAYVEFRIPQTPTTATVGIQPINLMNSWIGDDDFAAATFKTKLDAWTIGLGYIGAQNNPDRFAVKGTQNWGAYPMYTEDSNRIDSFLMYVDYAQGPLSASLVGVYTDARETAMGTDPTAMKTPVPATGVPRYTDSFGNSWYKDNQIADIGLNVGYKLDWMSAYVTFVKNFGSVDVPTQGTFIGSNFRIDDWGSVDYTGWMVDAGATFFCGPYTWNIGGFYTSGDDDPLDDEMGAFTYPLTTSKYFSEIVGGGILDNVGGAGLGGGWNGYQFPTNLWTVTIGGSWQALEKTKLSLSYWYFGTAEDVVSYANLRGTRVEQASDVGHEIDFYVTQGIVDGLTLDLVAAYLFAGDAYGQPFTYNATEYYSGNQDDDVMEFGARLQWNF